MPDLFEQNQKNDLYMNAFCFFALQVGLLNCVVLFGNCMDYRCGDDIGEGRQRKARW